MSSSIFTIIRWLLGLSLIVFGLNKFLGFASVPPPAGEAAITFLTTMFTTYLYVLVGGTQIVGGIMLLVNRTAFVGFLLLTPVVANIVIFHFTHAMPGNGLWGFILVVYLVTAYSFLGRIKSLFTATDFSTAETTNP
jgi:uncharacterized membrane protein YphA (DoxX/SURF4 family)